ncbi:glycosyltransferase family 39 protein [Streptomyces katsurahamanus]|uniref:glycosyltransferase family 39 protein n=1 Tax=Streptomyces katsurahamanus TaxID=2577098 RepID=UPI0018866328|nr:hypothetical protein [Streptomyces katsurahamanus]
MIDISTAAPPSARPSRRALSAPVVALLPAALMLGLGLWGIERQGTLWGDEAVTYEMAQRSLPEIWRTLATADAVHGLYYLLIHLVFAAWEPGLAALRLPSVLGMCATAAGVALIGRRLAGPRAGLLAGLVLPLLPTVQRYAQEGRSYALVCALVTWGTLRLWRRQWTAYAAVMLTACLLHEFAVLAVLAHGVTVWGGRARWGLWRGWSGQRRGWTVAALSVTVAIAPLALFSTTQSGQVEWIGRPGPAELGGFVALALVGWGCARTPGGARVRAVALPLLVLPPALLMAVSYVHPLFVDRYVLAYVIGLALLLGAVLDFHWSPVLALAAAGAALLTLVAFGPFLRSPESRKNDVTAVAEVAAELGRPGDGLLFTPMRRRVWTLARPDAFRGLTDLSLAASPRASDTLHGTELPPAAIRTALLGWAGRVVVFQDLKGEPLDAVPGEEMKREVLRRYFTLCEERVVGQVRVGVYARTGCGS